jgi:predicted HTH domain antitoxin
MKKPLILEISGDILEAVKLPPGEVETEFRQELALALYQRGILSVSKARTLAHLPRWEFEELLGQRRIPRHYTETELAEDVHYAQSHQ